MRRRSLLSVFAVGACSGCVEHPLPPLRGVVARKQIVGPSGTLLTVTGDGISVASSRLAEELPRDGRRANATITKAQLRHLPEVEYRVTIRHENRSYIDGVSPGETKKYRTNRETFNQVMVDDDLEFQVGVINRPVLLTPSRIVRTGTVEKKSVVGTIAPEGKKKTSRTVLSVTEDGVDANGKTRDADARVGEREAANLRNKFAAVDYSLTVAHGGRKRRYGTKRRQFNRAQVGKRIRFEVSGEYGGELVRFVA